MPITLRPPWTDLTYMSPLSADRARTLAAFLTAGDPDTVLDLGCGWAELLLDAVAMTPTASGIGVDSDEGSIAHGRTRAQERGLTERVQLIVGDARRDAPARADSVICIGASQIWSASDAADLPIDYQSALRALRSLVLRGGRVVYGEGIWSRPPTEAAAAPLSGRLDEFVTLAELVDQAVECGFMPVAVHEAGGDEWDEFESGYNACYAHWLAEHDPEDPDAAEVRNRAARQRHAYLGGYRGILGLAYLQLLAV